ncbi:hypothetical protein O1611_g1744 [Lasiodiplodia mahajangana]|uniref:Uncharacterized protein n=1 Tax=Lasiodiplodia mahajangana TaxID=1108764 RepID=A0ACC2JX35_9PEZI|nr:hypothetical protein O1611_g1744 [Lasiodiplodia mahajangana]
MAAHHQEITARSASGIGSTIVSPDWVTRAYSGDSVDANTPFEPAQEAYKEALVIFKQTLTKDPAKRRLADELLSTSTLGDVFNAVLDAKRESERVSRAPRLRECIEAFSERLLYYGNIMDVLVQHHPEYVSLAWGAMKFIFGAVVEHERTGTVVISALCDIADAVPSVELSLALYPTAVMRHAISLLYAHIVRFLIRALRYYEESGIMRAVHSITRPSALRYDDLIKLIRHDVEKVRRHAALSSQAEMRALHNSIIALHTQLKTETDRAQAERQDMQAKLATFGGFMTQIRVSLTEVQLRQALSMISSECKIDHKSALQSTAQMSDAPNFRQKSRYNSAAFWASPQLQAWNQSNASTAILLKSTFHQRNQIRSFCTKIVEQLLRDRVAVFWVLMNRDQEYSLLETLKSLVFQALSLDYSSHTDNSLSFEFTRYIGANTEEDYLNILGDLLQHLKRVYIIANSEAMSPGTAVQCRACLRRLSRKLSERDCQTVLKIVATSYGPDGSDRDSMEDFVLSVDTNRAHINHRRSRKRTRRRQGASKSTR